MTPSRMATLHALAFAHERSWSEQEFTSLLAQNGISAIGHAHAFALVRTVAGESELLTLATHPDHRRRGFARAITQEWLSRIQTQNTGAAFLEVASDNAAALALYRDLGFIETGRRKAYYARKSSEPADAITMFFDLTRRQATDSARPSQESG